MKHQLSTPIRIVMLVLCLMGWGASAGAAAPVLDPGYVPGLRAYWNTNAKSADRVGHVDWAFYDLVTQVDQVNFVKTKAPFHVDVPADYFAVRLVGKIDIPADGIWSFRLESDQSAILLIDGEPVVVDETSHSYRSKVGIVSLTPGLHDFEVRYWEGWSSAGLVVKWDGPGLNGHEVIPASAFSSPADEPVYDQGGEGLWAYWYHNVRHAKNVGQIDWANPDRVETVQRPSYRLTSGGFEVDGPADYFAARFIGVINVPDAGVWRFDLGSDQSALLFINGEPVVSDPSSHSYRWKSGTVHLAAGDHTIEVRYWEGWSSAGLHVAWQGPNDAYTEIIPSSAFRPGVGAVNLPSGGGLRAYRYDNARHASNIGGMNWIDHDSTETVQNVYWPLSSGAMYTGGPIDYHATRLVGKINFPRAGTWTIGLGSDQSARVYLGGQVAIDDTSGHSFRWRYGTGPAPQGEMPIEVHFWEGWSDSGLVLTWKGPGDEFESVIPATAFSLNKVDPALGVSGDGLLVYWVDNARHAARVGHIDWQNYDRTTFEANIAWELTSGVFPGTTTIDDQGQESTSFGGLKTDYFGLRAVGLIDIPSDGVWKFNLGSDQSAQLFINGQLLINDDSSHSHRWKSGTVELAAGLHDFEVRYWEGWSSAGLTVTWTPPGGVEVVIPPSAFTHADIQPDYDSGGGGLRAYWNTNARHASNAGQIDYAEHDYTTTVPNIAWRKTRGSLDNDAPDDYFGVRLLGQIDIPASGLWYFSLGSDQSAILFIDGEPVVVDTSSHSYRWKSGAIRLDKGKHDIEVRYWEGWSDAGLHLSWRGPTVPAEIIVPRTAFSLPVTDTPFEPGGGLRAYWTASARHASNAGQIDYAKHSSSSIVENVSWRLSKSSFYLDGPTDYFGLRLISQITVPKSGEWTFSLGSDQSAILLINDQPVVVDTSSHSYRWKSGKMTLDEGVHKFEIRYWEGWSSSGLNVTWRAPGSSFEEIIPASAFDVYVNEPVFDAGEAAITTQWFDGTRGYSINSMDWSTPTKVTTEPRVSWNITKGAFESGIGSDFFALKATGKLIVPRSGVWTFGVGSDQYAKLYINGQQVVNDTQSHSYRWRSGTIKLDAGEHELELQYMDGWSSAGAYLTWRGPGDLFEEVIPASAFASKPDRVRVVRWREIGAEQNR